MRDVIAKYRVDQIALQRLKDEKATMQVKLAALKAAYENLEEDIRGVVLLLTEKAAFFSL